MRSGTRAWRRAAANGHRPDDRGWGRGRRPVINVSWEDAKTYVGWLSRETGERYRLLSEAEWEYAARAGTTGPFHFGARISTNKANYDGNYTYGSGRKGVYRRKTMPVGSFPANAFGLHDVHGNVYEWVEDCWHGSYAGAPTDESAWVRGGDCGERVLRGGSWVRADRGSSARRSAAGTRPEDRDLSQSGSASPGRSPHESLPPYLLWGPGAKPLVEFFSSRDAALVGIRDAGGSARDRIPGSGVADGWWPRSLARPV